MTFSINFRLWRDKELRFCYKTMVSAIKAGSVWLSNLAIQSKCSEISTKVAEDSSEQYTGGNQCFVSSGTHRNGIHLSKHIRDVVDETEYPFTKGNPIFLFELNMVSV